jgi:hypothetical protein
VELDYILFSNLIDDYYQNIYRNLLGYPSNESYYKPLFLNHINETIGGLIALDNFPLDYMTRTGIINARKQFLKALKYSVENLNVKIILLAASTKRLFGKEIELRVNWDGNLDNTGFTLRELYPELLFTNGDNGTAIILEMEIDSVLKNQNISPEFEDYCDFMGDYFECSGTVIINGLGLLGTNSLLHLIENQFCNNQVIIISNHTKELEQIIGTRDVKVFTHINEIENHCCLGHKNNVKLIVNCTHHPEQMITAESISRFQNGQTLNVIDVAVPYGFPEEEYLKCNNVKRQDGGNAFIENGLEFFFNPEICGLTENVLYGCFAETMALSIFVKEKLENREFLNQLDFFNVNMKTKNFVKGLFDKYGIGIAEEPFNFMKRNGN